MKNYNIKLMISFVKQEQPQEDKTDSGAEGQKGFEMIDLGILYDGGRKCITKGLKRISYKFDQFYQMYTGPAGISGLEKITEEELADIENDFDPIGRINLTPRFLL